MRKSHSCKRQCRCSAPSHLIDGHPVAKVRILLGPGKTPAARVDLSNVVPLPRLHLPIMATGCTHQIRQNHADLRANRWRVDSRSNAPPRRHCRQCPKVGDVLSTPAPSQALRRRYVSEKNGLIQSSRRCDWPRGMVVKPPERDHQLRLYTLMSSIGRSFFSGFLLITSTVLMPAMTRPKTTRFPSRKGSSRSVM